MSADPLRLNLGSGRHHLAGWLNVDLDHGDQRVDLATFPWPFADQAAGEINASHILEHFTRDTGWSFLRECRRVLKRGGVLHLAVPDMDKFVTARLTGDYAPLAGYEWTNLNDLLGGGDAEPNVAWRHRYMYCFGSLAWTLGLVGFRDISGRAMLPIDNPAYEAISLYMDAER